MEPGIERWICRVSSPRADWTAVLIDGTWLNEPEPLFGSILDPQVITDPDVIEQLEDAVCRQAAEDWDKSRAAARPEVTADGSVR